MDSYTERRLPKCSTCGRALVVECPCGVTACDVYTPVDHCAVCDMGAWVDELQRKPIELCGLAKSGGSYARR